MEQRIHHNPKRRRMLTSIRIVKVVARKGLTPILKHPHQTAVSQFLGNPVFRQKPQTASSHRRPQDRHAAVERPLPLDPGLQFVPVFFKIPLQQAAVGGQAQIDAVVRGQIARRHGNRSVFEVLGRAHDGDAQRRADRYGDHVLGHLFTQTNTGVIALRNNVGEGVVDGNFDLDVRVVGQNLRQLGPEDIVRRMFGCCENRHCRKWFRRTRCL